MENQSGQWSLKYRPKTLNAFLGSDAIKKKAQAIIDKRDQNVILITGPSGGGKTTLAGIIARAINGVDENKNIIDYDERNMGTNGGIDDMRKLVQVAELLPSREENRRIICLEETHRLSSAAASALLRPLENPSNHVMWILCTNEPERLLSTIVGRAYPINLDLPDPNEHGRHLSRILHREKVLTKPAEKKAKMRLIKAVLENSANQPRIALQLLQSAVDSMEDYDNIADLVKSEIFQTPYATLDAAAVKIILGLMMTKERGSNNSKPILETLASQDGYALTQRLINIVEALLYELGGGVNQPQAWSFKKLAADRIKQIDIGGLITLLDYLIKARSNMVDFSIAPRPVLTNAILQCYDKFYNEAQS